MAEIEYVPYKDKDITGSFCIVSFPTVGLISTIAANFLIKNLKLERIGAFLSDDFFPAAIIQDGVPTPPVKVYAGDHVCGSNGECEQIVVISSELPVKPTSVMALADNILKWTNEMGCRITVTIEGINTDESLSFDEDAKVFYVSTTPMVEEMLSSIKSEKLESGMVSGLSGILLYKGHLMDLNVATLLAEANMEFPDSRSAAAVLRVLDKMVPGIHMDPAPLFEEADKIEGEIKKAMTQLKPTSPSLQEPPHSMYG
ncbi:MAG TPA: proteasome assembly chaperone family protein [Euryarchaeota archaeon]|nr:proteasome assembly chaperone family protein [Euryarchaeota archaeon]